MKDKKRVPVYLKFVLIVLVAALVGACAGMLIILRDVELSTALGQAEGWLSSLGPWWYLPNLVFLLISTILYLTQKKHMAAAEEDDQVFQQVNRRLGIALALSSVAMVCLLTAMPASYTALDGFPATIALLLVSILWLTVLQARLIAAAKKLCPEKRGNVFDTKFQKDWYQSCDEAERQQIGQCSYQVVLVSNYLFPALMVIFALLALGGMVGPGYCLLTGGIWLVFTLIYHLTALKLEAGSKAI